MRAGLVGIFFFAAVLASGHYFLAPMFCSGALSIPSLDPVQLCTDGALNRQGSMLLYFFAVAVAMLFGVLSALLPGRKRAEATKPDKPETFEEIIAAEEAKKKAASASAEPAKDTPKAASVVTPAVAAASAALSAEASSAPPKDGKKDGKDEPKPVPVSPEKVESAAEAAVTDAVLSASKDEAGKDVTGKDQDKKPEDAKPVAEKADAAEAASKPSDLKTDDEKPSDAKPSVSKPEGVAAVANTDAQKPAEEKKADAATTAKAAEPAAADAKAPEAEKAAAEKSSVAAANPVSLDRDFAQAEEFSLDDVRAAFESYERDAQTAAKAEPSMVPQAAETKPVEAKPVEEKPIEARPDIKPETKPVEAASAESAAQGYEASTIATAEAISAGLSANQNGIRRPFEGTVEDLVERFRQLRRIDGVNSVAQAQRLLDESTLGALSKGIDPKQHLSDVAHLVLAEDPDLKSSVVRGVVVHIAARLKELGVAQRPPGRTVQ